MAVEDPQNQLPDDDPMPPVHGDPVSESWEDPLNEFAPEPRRERLLHFAWEPLPPREQLIEFEPNWRGHGEANPLTESLAPAPAFSLSSPRSSSSRWFIGALMLGVGLVAGFAGGTAFVTQSGSNQNEPAQPLVQDRAASDAPPAVVQPAPPPPATARPADDSTDPLPSVTNGPSRTAEANIATPVPERPVTAPRSATAPPASREPAETIASRVTALYVQSNPAGAEVYLDDKLVSTTPFQLSDISPGRYTVRIEMQGYRPWSASVTVDAGARATISAVLGR